MNIIKKGLGLIKSPVDKRDYKFKDLFLGVMKIPDNYSSEIPSFIYDQGESSMCCACAYNTIRYIQESSKDQSELTEKLSPCFTYGNREDGQDYEGMLLRDCCKKGREGSILFNELPYFCTEAQAKEHVNANKQDYLTKANPFRISSFYTCNTREEIQQAVMLTKGVLIGIPVYKCFYEPDKDGKIQYSKKTRGSSYGGHAQALVGWITDENGKLWWKLINSWGEDWGVGGISYIPEDYPWMDDGYVIVDEITEMKFKDYNIKYGN